VHALYNVVAVLNVQRGNRALQDSPRRHWGNQSFLGEEKWLADHGVQLEVMQDIRCIELMREFMQKHPQLWAEDIGE
jgi:cytosine deaminase